MVDAGLLEEVKSILRRDLKLDANASIPDDTPLVGGEMDLDSLDILLVVSSIEKHFNIKIPNEILGRAIFQDVSTLTKFIAENREALAADRPAAAAAGIERDWLGLLPHGPEFRFVSNVTAVVPGQSASGLWNVTGSEPFFAGHFPGRPIVPGVLLIEALAQIAGLAVGDARSRGIGVMAHVDMKFESAVAPPAAIELHASVGRTIGPLRMCNVSAKIADRVIARGSVAIHLE